MTFGARGDRNVGFQATERCGFRDVYMARRALRDVLFLLTAAFVNVLRRDPFRRISDHVRSCRALVATVAVRGHRLLRLPVTVETRCVIGRNRFERRSPRSVTEGAVVVAHVLMFVVRKLDRELQLGDRIAKCVTHIITWRRL